MSEFVPVIGLEIHAELKTQSKMFCTCPNGYELPKEPNRNICPICLAQPGTLPTINEQAVKWTILVGLALNCQIARKTKFDRKNYFYPDLPKGYQISQYDQPLTYGGNLNIDGRDISLTRIHLEEDTGKLTHNPNGSLIDLSRVGTPLIELVTDPVIKSAKEAKNFAQTYQEILRYLGISEADMEKGQMRCEANISLQAAGKFIIEGSEVKPLLDYELNPKVELKNINSFRALERAVDYEIKRQTKLLEASEKVKQETRGWDETKKATFSQRSKEEAHDYRYFPEPDLPPLKYDKTQIELIKAKLPELPQQRRERFKKYGLPDANIEIFTVAKHLGDYYEHVASELDAAAMDYHKKKGLKGDEPTEPHILSMKLHALAANYIITEFPALLNMDSTKELDDIEGIKISPEAFAELMVLIFHKELSSTGAKAVLKEMAQTGLHPEQIMREKDMGQISNEGELETAIDEVIGENKQAVEDFKRGKEASLKFLIGKVMVKTKGRANPQIVEQLLKNKLGE